MLHVIIYWGLIQFENVPDWVWIMFWVSSVRMIIVWCYQFRDGFTKKRRERKEREFQELLKGKN